MITKIDKNSERIKRHKRIRNKISGTTERPRLSVFKSTNHIYAQIIDDVKGVTLVACSTVEKAIADAVKEMTKTEAAKYVGSELGRRAVEKGVTTVVFDRSGYLYMGRVEALADGAREAGLQF
ncbi:MAG: 50S ribosomal protein L18 [Clostridia bacterium]|nr:50S ribosomal protein L18 [Clostridia bacterium]